MTKIAASTKTVQLQQKQLKCFICYELSCVYFFFFQINLHKYFCSFSNNRQMLSDTGHKKIDVSVAVANKDQLSKTLFLYGHCFISFNIKNHKFGYFYVM